MMITFEKILEDLRHGKMIILLDDKSRENEGDLLVAAEKITSDHITFMAQFGRGLICVPLTQERAQELDLPPMTEKNTTPLKCNFTISVDAKKGVSTGISAFDRARTIKAMLNPRAQPDDFTRPGHVFPLIARPGGTRERRGHTEGAVDLMHLADLKPMAVICEIMGDDGHMLSGKKLEQFAKKYDLPITTIKEVSKRSTRVRPVSSPEKRQSTVITRAVKTTIPTDHGEFKMVVYTSSTDQKEHLALIKGDIKKQPVLTRVHSECLTGDVFGSLRCDCQRQLNASLKKIAAEESGILIYLRQEGRGIGLINKLKAYNLQDKGYDTVEANEKLGFKGDLRDYSIAGYILKDLGVSRIRLMTNNPEKLKDLEACGLHVTARVPLEIIPANKRERRYLATKKNKLGHLLKNI